MKKIILLGVAVLGGLFLFAQGPALLDLYRLMSFLERHTVAYEAEGPWPHLTDFCLGCHVSKGNQDYPSLTAQPAPYLASQLRKLASGERPSPLMGPLAMSLSEAQIAQVADFFSRQPPPQNPGFTADPALVEKGRELVTTRACAACHGEGMVGRDENPRLAGQGYNYLVAQLDAFAAGTRPSPVSGMNALAAALSPDDRRSIAAFLASSSAPAEVQGKAMATFLAASESDPTANSSLEQ